MKNILIIAFSLFAGLQVVAQEENQPDENKVYSYVQKKAEPEGGMQEFFQDFASKFNVPEVRNAVGVIGVRMKFVVEKDGSFTNIQIIEDKFNIGKEAIRVLKSMPKWNPAMHDDKIVRMYFTLPIKINIEPQLKPNTPIVPNGVNIDSQ